MEFVKPTIYKDCADLIVTQFFITQRRVYENKLKNIGHAALGTRKK